jgi:hypothetical protein
MMKPRARYSTLFPLFKKKTQQEHPSPWVSLIIYFQLLEKRKIKSLELS